MAHQLARRQVAELAVWPALIVVQARVFEFGLRVGEIDANWCTFKHSSRTPIERLDECIFDGLAGADEVALHAAAICSSLKRTQLEPGAKPV